MAHQHVAPDAPASSIEQAVRDSMGIHAQVASSAEQALALRVPGTGPDDVRRALWTDRTLVRTWAMRGTLHLLPASEYGAWVAAMWTKGNWRTGAWLRMVSMTEGEVEGMIAAVDRALTGRCLTRQELADAIGANLGDAARERLLSGWGVLLKPASYAGVLCSGPSRGQNVTFQRPVDWLGPLEEVESQEGLRRICRGYLHAYGPATHQDFGRWWGWASKARQLFRDLGEELAEVDVEGQRVWALAADVDAMRSIAPPRGSVRLLPGFDPYVLGSAPRTASVPEAFKARVSRAAGWISPVVLVDGVAVGVWRPSRADGQTTIAVEPFDGLSVAVRRRIERDARWLERCLGAIGGVTFVDQ